ncbi:MAG: glycoside hydrolase family 75 protein [Verrucomicrobiota bacterium]
MSSPGMKDWIWKALVAVLAVALVLALVLRPEERVVEKLVEVERVVEKRVEVPVEKIVEVMVPEPVIGIGPDKDLAKTSKGMGFKSELKVENGGMAIDERTRRSAYRSEHVLTVRVPRAAATIEELERGTPGLGELLPGLAAMVEEASVSDFFETLYANKTKRLKSESAKLGELLTSHNFFDCQTMLNLRAGSGRRVFLLQGDMDVVSDGSDGDRLPEMPDEIVNSTHYQYSTSYGWAKRGEVVNPLLVGFERRLEVARRELRDASVPKERKDWVRGRIRNLLEPGIDEMKRRSFLIAEYDPFIVIPMNIILDRRDKWGPKVGDYAVVIYEGVMYPAIVGDAGPTFKVGEASLRMARQIDGRSSPYRRPVSSLGVTYVCFPGTCEKPHRPPDYEFWRGRCMELLEEMGGLGEGEELFEWEDLLLKDEVREVEGD